MTPTESDESYQVRPWAGAAKRADFPEYKRWQNAFRPEDSGRAEGSQEVPASDAAVSHFDDRVRNHLASLIGSTANHFYSMDARHLAALTGQQSRFDHLDRLLEEKRAKHGRIPTTPLARKWSLLSCAFMASCVAVLVGGLSLQTPANAAFALLSAVFSSVVLATIAYACGLAIRRSRQFATLALATAIHLSLSIVLFLLLPDFPVGHVYGPSAKLGFAGLAWFALAAIAVVAYYSHDPDPEYVALEAEHAKVQAALAADTAQRIENREFHRQVGQRHIECARNVISTYRHSNRLSRPEHSPTPKFFDLKADLPELPDDWPPYLEFGQAPTMQKVGEVLSASAPRA